MIAETRFKSPAEQLRYLDERTRTTADGCWEWTQSLISDGYAKVVVGYRGRGQGVKQPVKAFAHRVVYQLFHGPVPKGLELDHLCRNRACMNPAHLEPVTRKENVRRGRLPAMMRAKAAAQAHCLRGHELSGGNLRLQGPGRMFRACRTCAKARRRERYLANRNENGGRG